jgi:hypothetical protein
MKEFEKWKQANIRGVHDPDYYMGLEEGWIAALECVLKNEDAYCTGESDDVGDWTECPTKIFIEKELNE